MANCHRSKTPSAFEAKARVNETQAFGGNGGESFDI